MKDRYKLKNGNILDGSCGDTGHTMFLEDVVRQLNRIARKDSQIASMKCCGNCITFTTNKHLEPNPVCNRCKRTSAFKTGNKPTVDRWIFAE